jgi:Ca-activated chloride channel homolog
MSKLLLLLCVLVCAFAVMAQEARAQEVTQGSLFAYGKDGKERGDCPLKTTSVKTDISGFLARVRVRQEFENTFSDPIEAVYTFPLSQNGAVDDMTMTIGSRTIRGKIMKREEARKVYESAKEEGKTASLLDQERPNIFTQSVANIMPGEKIIVEISYVETLKYEDGAYEFVFPMTVGPRYSPGSVKDASKIKPVYAEERTGRDISLEVNLNAGVPVEEIRSTSHDIQQINFAPHAANITLKNEKTIPNKDFILRYDVTGGKIQDAVLAHRGTHGGFFTLVLQPPDRFTSEDVTPKEIVFVLDTSGSMYGFPIEKAKEAMKLSLQGLHPYDRFNLITFAGDTHVLFPEPVPATQGNLERALAFLESRSGGGGTEMMKAIKASLDPSDSQTHLRIVCFMTDGYVGNEAEIVAEIQRHPNARVFSFGIGSSVNRYLLDKMAEAGNGEVEYVSLTDDGSKAAKRFHERVRTPLLTDLSIDWNGLPVTDVYPSKLSDLFSAKPVIVNGRYTKGMSGTIRLKGKVAGQEYTREIAVNLPEVEPANDVLATLWARKRIDGLMTKRGTDPSNLEKINSEITQLGLEFRLLTDSTSFVAVEDRIVNRNGKPVTVQVPVGVPEGVDPVMSGALDGVSLSAGVSQMVTVTSASISQLPVSRRKSEKRSKRGDSGAAGVGSGVGYGTGTGSGSGSGAPMLSGRQISAGVLNSAVTTTRDSAYVPASPQPLSPEAARIQKLKDKLHTSVWAVIERLEQQKAVSDESFVSDGKASIRITVSAFSPALLEKLLAAGFEMSAQKGIHLTGIIPIEKLGALAEMDEVKLILPAS